MTDTSGNKVNPGAMPGPTFAEWLKWFSNELKGKIIETGRSPEQLADDLGFTPKFVTDCLDRKHSPSYLARQKMAKTLGEKEDYFDSAWEAFCIKQGWEIPE